jgi:phage FluMu protein Com
MGMFDSFIEIVKCPKCKKEIVLELQTKVLGQSMRSFRKGDRMILNTLGGGGLEINYGKITDTVGHCPECEVPLKGNANIAGGKFTGFEQVKIWKLE